MNRFVVVGAAMLVAGCSDQPVSPLGSSATKPGYSVAEDNSPAGCVTDGICSLDPIIVDGGGGQPGGVGGTGGGGGDGGAPPSPGSGPCMASYDAESREYQSVQGCETGGSAGPAPTGEPAADDEVVTCRDLGCQLENPDSAQLAKIHAEIDEIRDEGFCGQVKANARAMVARHVQVWSNRVTVTVDGKEGTLLGEAPWDYSRGGPVMYLYTGSLNSWTIAHEAIHGLPNPATGNYYTHNNRTPLGLNLDDTAKYCSRN